MPKTKIAILALIAILAALRAAPAPADDKLVVAVGVAPLAYLAEQVGGDRLQVETLVGPGQSPHTFEPTARQMVRLGQAKLLFIIDLPFERVLAPKVAANNPGLRVIDLRQGLPTRHFGPAEAHHHDHDAEHHDHDHDVDHHHHDHDATHHHHDHDAEPDLHVWMSPRLASQMAAAMAQAFSAADPAGRDVYQANLADLQKRLADLDQAIARALAPLRGRQVFVFHPAFGYLLDDHGLRQVAIEFEGKSPGPKRLAQLIDLAKRQRVRVIFVQPQFSDASAKALAEAIDGAVLPLDPLAHDYEANLQAMATSIAQALQPQGAGQGR